MFFDCPFFVFICYGGCCARFIAGPPCTLAGALVWKTQTRSSAEKERETERDREREVASNRNLYTNGHK